MGIRRRSRAPQRLLLLALTLLALLPAPSPCAEERPRLEPANSLGYDVEVSSVPATAPPPATTAAADVDPNLPPLVERIGVPWSVLEPAAGAYAWEALDAAVAAAEASGHEIILNAYGGNPLYLTGGAAIRPADDAALRAWSDALRALASRYAARARYFQIGRFPDRGLGGATAEAARDYAFVFKKSATAIRSAAPEARIALGTIDPASQDFAAALTGEEIAPYTDAISVTYDNSDAARAGLEKIAGLLLATDPGAKLWINGVPLFLGVPGYGALLRAYVAGLEHEAALVTFLDPADAQGRPFHLAAMERARRTFTPAYSPLVESGRGVQILTGEGKALPGARATRFFDPDSKTVLMPYDGGPSARAGDFAVVVLDTADAAGPSLHDLASGESNAAITLQKDAAAGVSRAALPLADYPLVLKYHRFTTPEYAKQGEKVAVTGEKLPSAEEIIARHQAVQDAQDALFKNLMAESEETWHFTAGAGGSVDVMWKQSIYLDPNVGLEKEQKEIYLNGVRWRLGNIPELPFIISEKTWSQPLKISLTKQFNYEYVGRETVEGHDCWVVSFASNDPTGKKLRGRVWIDTGNYTRVRLHSVQSELTDPLVSNDQTDTYGPVTGPEGYVYSIPTRIDAQTIYAILGANLAIIKRVEMHEFSINDPGFDERRKEAFASNHKMIRDTDQGLRYLERTSDGGREVKENVSHRNLFIVGGVYYDRSLDFPVPLAGVNYLDTDLAKKGLQANVFFAGVLAFANLTDPRFFGTRLDASADLTLWGINLKDRLIRDLPNGDAEEVEEEQVLRKAQTFSFGLGVPFAKFFKIKGEGRMQYIDYGRADDTSKTFFEPRDTWERQGSLNATFNRKAWGVSLQQSWTERTRNEPWGFVDPNTGMLPASGQADFFEGARDYVRYSGTVSKEFYLPLHQKLLAQVEGFGGRDLDRFSKYKVSFFDNRVQGFAGSGLRYTNGAIGTLRYAFTLADIIRFEASVDHARVKDRQLGEPFRDFTGFGLSGQCIGPWGLLFRLDYGVAVASDVEDFRGRQEILLSVLKLFSQK